MAPYARPGWAELTQQRAAREYSNPLLSGSLTGIDLERARESHVIGQRVGGVLENITGALHVPPGVRFRSDSCSLVESGEEWVEPRAEGRIATCSSCAGFLRGIVVAAQRLAERSAEPHPFTNHRHIVRDDATRQLSALAAGAARTVAANQTARRARADEAQLRESLTPPSSCSVSKTLTSKFEELQDSDEFKRCFPKDSVARYIWEDQMKNNKKAAAGCRKTPFR